MTPQEMSELDLAVAKVEGYARCWVEHDPYGGVQCFAERDDSWGFSPTRDRAEAMRLLEKFHMVLLPPYRSRTTWSAGSVHAKPDVYCDGETPMIAICKAVVALGGKT